MITDAQLSEVGKVLKTHGVNGEMSMLFDIADFDAIVTAGACLVFDIDGINVPFFVKSARGRGNDSLLVTLDGEDSQPKAAMFVGKLVYMLSDQLPDESDDVDDDGFYASDLVGYRAVTDSGEDLGEIVDIDDTTVNALFVIDSPGQDKPLLLPVADEMIEGIDASKHVITFSLPEGILDL